MKEGQLKSSNRSGCLMYLALIYAFDTVQNFV